ncbi:MAG TPA: 16S rRNA (cytidine(1402)-2'-O)-methyltransferase [Patescibacteria group bacterium]|nr:16S rRNA (cytidine(1402)-2'-O)-methyltransferase [Patescibacteria group bacterium]
MLYIVATPIGNLKDITLRALEVFKKVDYILAEDTRNTARLLKHYDIKTATLSFHQHSNDKKIDLVLRKLKNGKNLALVSDAGTPTIADPGGKLVAKVKKEAPNIKIVPIPGASALLAGLSVSGFKADSFTFFGFPPKKRKRNKFFKMVAKSDKTSVLYESPHRIIKTLDDLNSFKEIRVKDICVFRELTKIYESSYCGTIREVLKSLKSDKIKGEFTIVISG